MLLFTLFYLSVKLWCSDRFCLFLASRRDTSTVSASRDAQRVPPVVRQGSTRPSRRSGLRPRYRRHQTPTAQLIQAVQALIVQKTSSRDLYWNVSSGLCRLTLRRRRLQNRPQPHVRFDAYCRPSRRRNKFTIRRLDLGQVLRWPTSVECTTPTTSWRRPCGRRSRTFRDRSPRLIVLIRRRIHDQFLSRNSQRATASLLN